jgi:hypothetical protein
MMPQAWMRWRGSSKRQVLPYDVNGRHSPISGLFATLFHFAIPPETGSRYFTGHRWLPSLLRLAAASPAFEPARRAWDMLCLWSQILRPHSPSTRDLLGFQISDYMRTPKICFLHVNARHHSLALFENPRQGIHHLLVELYSLDDVGQGYDIARAQADRVKVSLGRHNNDYMTSFYMQTPSNFLIEYGWGGREVDVATWQPIEMSTLASFWGHEGLRQSVLGDAPPPAHSPPEGRRAPVQVIEGKYERLSGVCPWWDAVTAGR